MGSPLVKLIFAVVAAGIIYGCGRMSEETARDRDQQRIETARGMPGNDIPQDPADNSR